MNSPKVPFLDLKAQYSHIKQEIEQAWAAVMEECAFVGNASNRFTKQFELEFAGYLGAKGCVGVANGTDALEIAIEALELPAHSEILVPANSFVASAEAVSRNGHQIIFCDVDPDSYCILVEDASKRISKNTKVIIAVHLYGHPCDMDPLLQLAKEYDLYIIEDCAQAHGAEYRGSRVGTLGTISAFSFFPGKNLGAYGDAGAIVSNNGQLLERCRMIANHGRLDKYDHQMEGRNSRLDALQAAVLSVKLKYLDAWLKKRRFAAQCYEKYLQGFELVLPKVAFWAKSAWHLYVVRCLKRDDLRQFLMQHGVETGVHYPIALPYLKAYQHLEQKNDKLFANTIGNEVLSLPMGEHLDEENVEWAASVIKKYLC